MCQRHTKKHDELAIKDETNHDGADNRSGGIKNKDRKCEVGHSTRGENRQNKIGKISRKYQTMTLSIVLLYLAFCTGKALCKHV